MTSVGIVTGAGSGIGAACADALVGTVDVLVLNDMNGRAVSEQVAELAGRGTTCETVVGDLTDAACRAELLARASARGTLRSIAHVAGISPTMSDWPRVLEVDLVATARLVDGVLALATRDCAMVCFASMAAYLNAQPNAAADAAVDAPLAAEFFDAYRAALGEQADDPGVAYSWAKRGVQRLVQREAAAFGAKGARICSISPGMIDTPMGRQEYEQQPMMKVLEEMTPLHRIGRAEELAAVVQFLLSDAASFITGTDLLVDGGAVAAVAAMLSI
jgi:NAD(P)-dependent dehydrogenase (short-subunit alcohol dehydrogenase family)